MPTPSVTFNTLSEPEHAPAVVEMMTALYAEDAAGHPVSASHFPETIGHLMNSPQEGRIVLFRESGTVVGYALLIPYWSNEFGGRIVFVDEIYVRPEDRNRGIATAFFETLRNQRPFGAVALALEVSPENGKARRLYETLGFEGRELATMVSVLDD